MDRFLKPRGNGWLVQRQISRRLTDFPGVHVAFSLRRHAVKVEIRPVRMHQDQAQQRSGQVSQG